MRSFSYRDSSDMCYCLTGPFPGVWVMLCGTNVSTDWWSWLFRLEMVVQRIVSDPNPNSSINAHLAYLDKKSVMAVIKLTVWFYHSMTTCHFNIAILEETRIY